jgi:hypothetical protein
MKAWMASCATRRGPRLATAAGRDSRAGRQSDAHLLTKRRLKRGVFCSIVDLQAAINHYLAEHNHKSKPFVWKADPKRVLAAIERGKQALESIH